MLRDDSTTIKQFTLRSDIERGLRQSGARIHGSGTDLTTGIMDISFDVDGIAYRLDLRRVERNDRED